MKFPLPHECPHQTNGWCSLCVAKLAGDQLALAEACKALLQHLEHYHLGQGPVPDAARYALAQVEGSGITRSDMSRRSP